MSESRAGLKARLREARGAADSRLVLGVVLVAIGVALIATRLFHGLAEGGAVLIVGVVLLALWAVNDRYGHLVLGCILSSLGVGGVIAGHVGSGHAGSIALGGGFVAIYVLDLLRNRSGHWWPLVPGAALIVGGALAETSVLREFFWPVALVIVGLLILSGEWRRRGPGDGPRRGRGRGAGRGPFGGAGGRFGSGGPFGSPGGPADVPGGSVEVVEGKVVAEDDATPPAAAGGDPRP